MGGAVEMCSGLGACRKKLDGTMCPSYMATREEDALDARPRQRAAAGDGRAGWANPASATRACTRCSTCASSAGRARPSARSAWTWRGSRASSSPTTGAPRHAAPRARARPHPRAVALGEPPGAASRTGRAERARPLDQRSGARHRCRRIPPAWASRTFRRRFESGSGLELCC